MYGALLAHRELYVLRGHEDWMRSAAFSPDGGKVIAENIKLFRAGKPVPDMIDRDKGY